MMDWYQSYNTKAVKSTTKADTQYPKLQNVDVATNWILSSEANIMDLNEQFFSTSQGFEGATEYANVSGWKLIIPKPDPSSVRKPHQRLRLMVAPSILLSAPAYRYCIAVAGRLSAQILFSKNIEEMVAYNWRFSERLSVLEEQLKELNEELRTRPIIRNTNLWELNSARYHLTNPINIVIEEYPDETVTRWPEVEAFGSGATEPEAIAILKQDIVSLFEDLVASPDDELGKLPQGWKRILLRIIKNNE